MYLYFKFGRAKKPSELKAGAGHDHHDMDHKDAAAMNDAKEMDMDHSAMDHSAMDHSAMDHAHIHHGASSAKDLEAGGAHASHSHHQHSMAENIPGWAVILISVSHCGAGCVLGDIVGEFIIYGSGASINGRDLWPCLLTDFVFALFFGIFFQYFSIAPMSGQWGPKTLWRAAKADFLSLVCFEIGLFAWMVAYQVGIWPDLKMISWLYWWQMQIGMFLGYLTAIPVNYFLITWKIKEPCV
jgi:hypothetical protein